MHNIEQFMKIMRMIHRTALPKNILEMDGAITPLQLEALLYLRRYSRSTVSALGKYLQLSSSATAQLTDRLAKTTFIKRENNPHDHRSVTLLLTPKGGRIFPKLHKVHIEKMKGLLALMPKKDVKELTRIFGKSSSEFRGSKK